MDASQHFGRFSNRSITLQAHVHLVVNDDPQVSFFCSAIQLSTAKPIRMLQVFPPKVENLAFFGVKHHEVLICPFAELVQVSITRLSSGVDALPQSLVSSANLASPLLTPMSTSLVKMLNRMGPRTEP